MAKHGVGLEVVGRPVCDVPDVHPIHAPMPGIVVKQRDDLAHWLRMRGMVRYDSHQVARDPGARWWIMHGSDGWVRAKPVEGYSKSTPAFVRHKVSRAGIYITEAYVMRFIRLPVDS